MEGWIIACKYKVIMNSKGRALEDSEICGSPIFQLTSLSIIKISKCGYLGKGGVVDVLGNTDIV